ILRLKARLDNAKLALIMSVSDLYFKLSKEEDEAILYDMKNEYPEEGEAIMELMPAWKKWGYDEGREEGREEGRQEGRQEGRAEAIRKLLNKGLAPEKVADLLELPIDEVNKTVST